MKILRKKREAHAPSKHKTANSLANTAGIADAKVSLMKVKALILFLALAGLLPMASKAQLTYTTNNGAIIITGYNGTNVNVVIPSATNGYPVTTIGANAFSNHTSVTSVAIPSTVTNIGDNAFTSSGLTNITIPIGVTSVGQYVFSSCSQLSSATINSRITGRDEFQFCANLANVVISTNVTFIADECFGFCRSLTNIIIPNSVTYVGLSVFYADYGIKNIVIGTNVTFIGGGAFEICGMTNIIIPASVNSIGSAAFAACKNLTAINVDPNNLFYESVNGVLFTQNPTQLVTFPCGISGSYTIPNSVTNLGNYAFANCTSLKSVTIPNSVANIDSISFYICTGLTNITFLGNAPTFVILPGIPYDFTTWGVSATIYYYYGTSGWDTTYGGLPTFMLGAPAPQIEGGNVGVQAGSFGFAIAGVTNQTIVVEASTNLVNWQPVWSNTLSGASATFTDSQWTNYPARFYRAR